MSQTQATLVYVGDPMCSWCYGIAPELAKAVKSLEKEAELEIVMGGLRPYNTETMVELGDFLRKHWQHVHQASGQEFSYGILDNKTFVYDTEPPSRAVLVVRKLRPEKEFAFFKAIQDAFYQDNQNTNYLETYLPLVRELGIDEAAFRREFLSDDMKEATRRDFQRAANLGVRSFPTLLLRKGDEYHVIANGFAKSEQIVSTVRSLVNQ
ncbi:MAG: DsbA family protein [Bacteroidota bacterium]